MYNSQVKYPKVGDIVLGRLSDKKVVYIASESYVDGLINQSQYEKIGVVGIVDNRGVTVVYKTTASKKWATRRRVRLYNYPTLDGSTQSIGITGAFNQNYTNATITIDLTNVTTKEQLCERIQSTLMTETEAKRQWLKDFHTFIENDEVIVCGTFEHHGDNNGFSTAVNCKIEPQTIPQFPYVSGIFRKNGMLGPTYNNWVMCCNERFTAYFINANNGEDTSIDRTAANWWSTSQPLKKATYLGNSADGQDHCEWMRSVFGEGEDGYRTYLQTFAPIENCDKGVLSLRNVGKEYTYKEASIMDDMGNPWCIASHWASSVETQCIPQGEWYLGDMNDVYAIMRNIKYGIRAQRNSDAVNAGLEKIGGSSISCTANWWTSVRYGTTNSWIYSGSRGSFSGAEMSLACGVFALALIPFEN